MPASDPLLGLIRDATSSSGRAVSQSPQTYGAPTTDEALSRFSGLATGLANGYPAIDKTTWFPALPLYMLSRQPSDPGGTIDILSCVQVAGPPGDSPPLGTIINSTIGRIVYE